MFTSKSKNFGVGVNNKKNSLVSHYLLIQEDNNDFKAYNKCHFLKEIFDYKS